MSHNTRREPNPLREHYPIKPVAPVIPVESKARKVIERGTHGSPPDRACLPGSDEKWEGYLLGVEDAIHATEEWLGRGIGQERVIPATDLRTFMHRELANALATANPDHAAIRRLGERFEAWLDEYTAKAPSGREA